jgi:5-methylcytosine-specific restriction endonuclease McrA
MNRKTLARAYRFIKKQRNVKNTPKWITPEHFYNLYSNKTDSLSLDHIIPLHHPLVSGLNVPWNIQLLDIKVNELKGNLFDGTYENKSWMLTE